MQMTNGEKRNGLLLRSVMYVPAYNKRYIEKALASDADALVLDLEDSVPEANKAEARGNIRRYAEAGALAHKTVFVRVNAMGTYDFTEDISTILCDGITGIMPSKIKGPGDIVFADKLLAFFEIKLGFEVGKFVLAPLVETLGAVENIYEIAHASPRLVALAFGGEDYLDDLNSTYTYQTAAFAYPRSKIVAAARSAQLIPLDTPYLEIDDIDGFIKTEKEMYKVGFGGCTLLHPKQIEPANTVFSPSKAEVEYSRGLIEAIQKCEEEKQSGVAMYRGMLVGPPMKKRAHRVIEQMRLIEEKEKGNAARPVGCGG